MEIAAGVHDGPVAIDICPNVDDDTLARVHFGDEGPQHVRDLFAAIPMRRTSRTKFEENLLPNELAGQYQDIAGQYGVEFTLISDIDSRSAIADLVAEGY